MHSIRFIMVGGFLGSGKTTTIARLARAYQDRGLKVGIVTNDQAADLVDTQSLRSQGHLVGEVAGACFCCNFNELIKTVGSLEAAGQPDVILGRTGGQLHGFGGDRDPAAGAVVQCAVRRGAIRRDPEAQPWPADLERRAGPPAFRARRLTSSASSWKRPIFC